jgi:hypothetical protein
LRGTVTESQLVRISVRITSLILGDSTARSTAVSAFAQYYVEWNSPSVFPEGKSKGPNLGSGLS